jgi:hypothetical protein
VAVDVGRKSDWGPKNVVPDRHQVSLRRYGTLYRQLKPFRCINSLDHTKPALNLQIAQVFDLAFHQLPPIELLPNRRNAATSCTLMAWALIASQLRPKREAEPISGSDAPLIEQVTQHSITAPADMSEPVDFSQLIKGWGQPEMRCRRLRAFELPRRMQLSMSRRSVRIRTSSASASRALFFACPAFEISRRRDNLTFNHNAEVTGAAGTRITGAQTSALQISDFVTYFVT